MDLGYFSAWLKLEAGVYSNRKNPVIPFRKRSGKPVASRLPALTPPQ
jgi:hypothetical protein